MSVNLPDLINAIDEAIRTIRRLAELGPVIDGNPALFANLIEILSLINERAGHLEKLSEQLTQRMLPRPDRMEEDPR